MTTNGCSTGGEIVRVIAITVWRTPAAVALRTMGLYTFTERLGFIGGVQKGVAHGGF